METQEMVYTMIARYNDTLDHMYEFYKKGEEVYPDSFVGAMTEPWETFYGAFVREAIDLCCIANELNDGNDYGTSDAWFVGPRQKDGNITILLPADTVEEDEGSQITE